MAFFSKKTNFLQLAHKVGNHLELKVHSPVIYSVVESSIGIGTCSKIEVCVTAIVVGLSHVALES